MDVSVRAVVGRPSAMFTPAGIKLSAAAAAFRTAQYTYYITSVSASQALIYYRSSISWHHQRINSVLLDAEKGERI